MNEAEKLINRLYGKGTIGFTCDNCGRELNSCSIVNGMKFCAKCYQETFGKDNQQNEIKQLKQQLEEKDKEIEKLKQQYTILENENGKLTTELIMDKYKKAQKEVSFGKQLAIQELEKVKILIQNAINFVRPNFVEVYDAINKQIKELKGE